MAVAGFLGATVLRTAQAQARMELPGDWLPIIGQEATKARRGWQLDGLSENDRESNAAAVWQRYLDNYGGEVAAQLCDADIKRQAQKFANEAAELDMGELTGAGDAAEAARLERFCKAREVLPPDDKLTLAGRGARVRCQYWWRRALRKRVAAKAEGGAQRMGLVSAPNGQPYASDHAVKRRIEQNARNRAALANITLENDEGYRRTLAELSATSTSNKSIRRGELMTRIRGCEEIADSLGHAGLFCTLTAPTRFHSTLRNGKRNPKHDGSTPKEGQAWMCAKWAQVRAELARRGITLYGFRVAEPHHDGCVHWHLLVWAETGLERAQGVMRDYWISEEADALSDAEFDDCALELDAVSMPFEWRAQGTPYSEAQREYMAAARWRTNFKVMIAGGAASYIAKYISKNIDDHGIDSHLDDYSDSAIGPDLLGDLEIKPCQRVEAWASAWGIRQFQPLGQPPVTVWRELRRITQANAMQAGGHKSTIFKAWFAAQKCGTIQASWARYVNAQGGMAQGRKCRVVMRCDLQERTGLYESSVQAIPVGVALNIPKSRTVWSERRLWRAVDKSASVPVCAFAATKLQPRTGVNNCTESIQKPDAPDAIPGAVWTFAPDKSGSWSGGVEEFRGWEGKPEPESTKTWQMTTS